MGASALSSGAVAFWDFHEAQPPYVSADGAHSLDNGPGSHVTTVAGGPLPTAICLDGVSDYLRISNGRLGALDLSAAGACTVLAWVRRTRGGHNFVAGLWQEDDAAPARQYGLFVNLPMYGGADQVCGHVSRTGGPTPGYPYSRDYSASSRTVPIGEWHSAAFTYDGVRVISYLDGEADARPDYVDIAGARYSKNPYIFRDGLNPDSHGDFTVGAVLLSRGMGNFFAGQIAGLAVFDRALDPAEIHAVASWTPTASAEVRTAATSPVGDRRSEAR